MDNDLEVHEWYVKCINVICGNTPVIWLYINVTEILQCWGLIGL